MSRGAADRPSGPLVVRRRAAWPAALASAVAVAGVVALPTLLPGPAPDRDPGVLPVLPDPAGVDHAVESQPTVTAPRRITRVPNRPAVAESPSTAPPPDPSPVATSAPMPVPAPPPGVGNPAEHGEPTAGPTGGPTGGPAGGPGLAVRADEVPAMVVDLVGGTVDDARTWGDADEVSADFRLDGLATWLFVVRAAGPTPTASCRDTPGRAASCLRHPDGSVHTEETSTAPEADGGATSNAVTWWTVDGWQVLVRSSNAPEHKEARPTQPEPGLSIAELMEVAGSDAWFG